jgi:hypothetical protein
VVISDVPKNKDPHLYFYKAHRITPDTSWLKPKQPLVQNFQGIDKFFIGDELYTLTWGVNPGTAYDHYLEDIGHLSVLKIDGIQYNLTKQQYVQLMNDFAQLMHFKKLNKLETIQERR